VAQWLFPDIDSRIFGSVGVPTGQGGVLKVWP
jgi:hypothetical protein